MYKMTDENSSSDNSMNTDSQWSQDDCSDSEIYGSTYSRIEAEEIDKLRIKFDQEIT